MASTRPDWKPSERTLREERERGQCREINPKALPGPTLEEMLADLARVDDEDGTDF